MTKNFIGADHEFHDEAFAQDWADRFAPTPERIRLFNLILSEFQSVIPGEGYIVELGIGPGYLASHILSANPLVNYIGIDFSQAMLEIAGSRLRQYSQRLDLIQMDLIEDDWELTITNPVNAIVSTWALHDLGSQENTGKVYSKVEKLLIKDGIFLNGDFVKPEETQHEFEGGRFQVNRHLEMLESTGFKDTSCLAYFEKEIASPTPAQNYACLKAVK